MPRRRTIIGAMDVSEIRDDLVAEQKSLDDVVSDLTIEQWDLATPSPGWSVADQIAHLTYFDGTASLAIENPEGFAQSTEELLSLMASSDQSEADNATIGRYRSLSTHALLAQWRANRSALANVAATLENDSRIEWYGPSMGSKSFLTARLMETWAHGQDIVDALNAERQATDRLRHIAQLGFITRGWTYINRGLEMPDTPVRVELLSPSGETWTFGPVDAAESIVGSGEDFCLVTTQRRHVDDTGLAVTGASARDWMEKAQLFAGPPSDGPAAAVNG
jgi:uncharacterized protein (TIGR03084 family)